MGSKFLVKSIVAATVAIAGTSLASLPTYADVFTLSVCNSGLGCGTGNNFGTVTVTNDGANTVKIDVDLASGVVWAGTGLVGFAMYLPGISAPVNLTNAPAGSVLPSAFWTPNTNGAALLTSFDTDGFKGAGGTQIANFGLDRTDSGTGSNDSSNLTFDITAAGLSVASFQSWVGNDAKGPPPVPVYFIADIGIPCSGTGCPTSGFNTGLVGATAAVPGPIVGAGLPGIAFACAGLLALARRRRQTLA